MIEHTSFMHAFKFYSEMSDTADCIKFVQQIEYEYEKNCWGSMGRNFNKMKWLGEYLYLFLISSSLDILNEASFKVGLQYA